MLHEFILDKMANLVSYATVMSECFFFGRCHPCEFWWIVKACMNDACFSQKIRAILGGITTNRNHQIEWNVGQTVDQFGMLTGNVHAQFQHDSNGIGIHPVGFNASGIGINLVRQQMTRPTFGHLAPACIAHANE